MDLKQDLISITKEDLISITRNFLEQLSIVAIYGSEIYVCGTSLSPWDTIREDYQYSGLVVMSLLWLKWRIHINNFLA